MKEKRRGRKKSAEAGAKVRPAAESKQTAKKEDKDTLNEHLLRLQADFENFRKRTLREKNELYRRANEDIMQEFLPVLDHLDLALEAANTHKAESAVVEGFRLVSEQILSVLNKFGLVPIDVEGQQFDPNRHEAISRMVSGEVPENTVITQVRRGYMLGDKLLRAAQVVVSEGARGA